MKDDGSSTNDYTKCVLYKEFGMEIDWEEATTTTTSTTTKTTTSGHPDQILQGTKCNGNIFEDSRIIGGIDAVPHSWPWMAQIRYWQSQLNNSQYCGGSILNRNAILTAAHCCTLAKKSYRIRIGDHSMDQVEDGEQYDNNNNNNNSNNYQ